MPFSQLSTFADSASLHLSIDFVMFFLEAEKNAAGSEQSALFSIFLSNPCCANESSYSSVPCARQRHRLSAKKSKKKAYVSIKWFSIENRQIYPWNRKKDKPICCFQLLLFSNRFLLVELSLEIVLF